MSGRRPIPRTVLFDFDYTLADSSSAVVECCNLALEGIGLPPAHPQRIRRTIGLSIPDTLATLAGEEYRPRVEEFRRHWRVRSDAIMVKKTRLYPETRTAVAALRAEDIRLGIVSTKWRQRILDVLGREELLDAFSAVVGGDDVTDVKPHPEGLFAAMESLGASPQETVYVGDSPTDAEAARRAGVGFVAVLSGVTEEHEFRSFAPLCVLPHVGRVEPGVLAAGAGTIRP